jgi:carbonic anhydrase/acetyltransferase-like protein (isoleucine patch superfamily)
MSIERFENDSPKIAESAMIHQNATVIGQVTIGENVSIWPHVTLRGDEGKIEIGDNTNLQDGTVVHMTGGYSHTKIGARVTVGHMCLLHGCTVEDDCLIGMGSILLDACHIGTGSYIAAGTMIAGAKVIPPHSFVKGRPGALTITPITEKLQTEKAYSWQHYVDLKNRYTNPKSN